MQQRSWKEHRSCSLGTGALLLLTCSQWVSPRLATLACPLTICAQRADWVKQSSQSYKCASGRNSIRTWEKYPKRFRHLYETLLSEHVGRHCREWPTGKCGRGGQISYWGKQKTIWSHSVHHCWLGRHIRLIRFGLHCKSKVLQPSMKTVPPKRSQRPASWWKMEAATHGVPPEETTRPLVILIDSMNLLPKMKRGRNRKYTYRLVYYSVRRPSS